jgi:hypothetical protein
VVQERRTHHTTGWQVDVVQAMACVVMATISMIDIGAFN